MSTASYEESLFINLTDIYEMTHDNETAFSNGPSHCGNRLENDDYRFWLDGVLVSVIGSAGFVGNLLALIVLSRPQLRDVFHQLLFALACFDLLFIVFGGISYTFRAFMVSTDVYTYIFPYLVHPFSQIAMAGTIFMTLAISIERYLGLCHPLLPPHSRKPWMYILPVVVVSIALNVPKFLEITVKMEYDNATGVEYPTIENTELRHKKHYILGYVMWTRLFSTAVIPVTLLVYLNIRIIIDLMNSTKVQRFGSTRRQRKEINLSIVLLCIVVIFFCCHAARIILDIYEFTNVDKIMGCRPFAWWPASEMQILVFFSHLLMILNSSVNFVVYCLVGHTFRREMCRTFGLRKYSRVPGGGMSRRSSRYDFSMAAPATGITPNPMSVVANTAFNSSGSTARFLPSAPSNGNIRFNNGTNSIKCVAIVTNDKASTNSNSSSNAIVMLPHKDSPIFSHEESALLEKCLIDSKIVEDSLIENNVEENNVKGNTENENSMHENNAVESIITENNVNENSVTDNNTHENHETLNNETDNNTTENNMSENNAVENSMVENEVFENNVTENSVLENDVVENSIVDSEVFEKNALENNLSQGNKTSNGRLLKDNSDEDNSEEPMVTSCLIENFSEKKNAIFV